MSIVLYFDFTEGTGTTLHDNSGNGNDGTFYNIYNDPPRWEAGPYEGVYSINFRYLKDYVYVPEADVLSYFDELTIAFYMYIETYLQTQWFHPFEIGHKVSVYMTPLNIMKALYIKIRTEDGLEEDLVTRDIEKSRWYHVCVTYDGEFFRTYINARLRRSVCQTGAISIPTPDMYIGCSYVKGNTIYNSFPGKVSEFIIFDKALSKNDVIDIYKYHEIPYV